MFRRRERASDPERAVPRGGGRSSGGQQGSGPGAGATGGRGGGALVVPTPAIVRHLLGELGLQVELDDDGDLVVRREQYSLYLFFYGKRQEVVQARLYLNRRFAVESRTAVVLMLDDWNRTKLFPKAYTVLPDDGMVGICAEHCYDFEVGATRAQLRYTLGMWIDTLLRFAEWIDLHVVETP